MPREYIIPDFYGMVESDIYRCGVPQQQNFEFIKSLNLKTFLYLSQETLTRQLREFFQQNKIEVVSEFRFHSEKNLGLDIQLRKRHLNEFLVKESIEILLDRKNYPIMISCK